MSGIDAGTMLLYLSGAAMFVCIVMVVYWSMQRVPPGFGLWAVSCALIGFGCLALADSTRLPRPVIVLVAPFLVQLAALLRLQGVRQFFGRRSMDWWVFLLPLVPVAVISVFAYTWDNGGVRIVITAVVVAATVWLMAGVAIRHKQVSGSWFSRLVVALFLAYGALWILAGVHWLVSSSGFPLDQVDAAAVVFFAALTAYELFWLTVCLIVSAKRNAELMEAAHDEVERTRRQLADIVTFLPDATFALDKDQKVIAWNQVIADKTGVPASQVVGRPWDESGAYELVGGGATLSEALLCPEKTISPRCTNVRRDGDTISAQQEWRHPTDPLRRGHFWHTATLLRDADGQVAGAIESIRDITAAAEAASAIRESEERYRSLFDHSLDGVLVIAPGGTVVDANPSACRMLGMTREEICEADPGSLVDRNGDVGGGEGIDPHESAFSGTGVRELDFVRGDGSTFPAECMSVVWTDSGGHVRAFVSFRDIGERTQARKILQESQASLLQKQTSSHTGSWEIDLVGQSIWLSSGAMQIFGIDHHVPYFPLESGTLTDLSEEPAVLQEALMRVMSEGGSYDVEYSIRRANDGALRTVHSVGSAICDAQGATVKVVGVTQDLTELPDVPRPDDMSLYVMDHSDDPVFWIDDQGRIANVNESACSQLGYTRQELTSMNIYELNPSLPAGTAEAIDTVKQVGTRRYETVHLAKDGRHIPVEAIVNYASHQGEEYKFVVTHDISGRKALEERLRRTQLSLERGGGAILWADEQGQLTFATDEACARLDLRREQLLGMKVCDVHMAGRTEWKKIWAELAEHGSFAHEAACQIGDGTEKRMDVVFHRMEYENNDYALVVFHDIPERGSEASGAADADLATLQSQELEAVGQLAGGIAHDFNNLLTAIIGYGDLILSDEGAQHPGQLHRDVNEIRNAAQRAAELTSQILAFARRQPLRPRRVDLAGLVGEMEERLLETLSDDVRLTITTAAESATVEVDTEQFERALFNLVMNAQEAMPGGGRLHIEVDEVELTEESCRAYPELRAGLYAVVAVSDTGVGMDAATKQRIFEPFFTTKSPGDGPGLGLSVAYGFVRQSGGNVVAYSEVDKGTTMKIYLPTVPEEAESIESVSLSEEGLTGAGTESVLVVDDEAPLRRLVARVLGESGYQVFVAGSGREALELLEDMQHLPDLLITDVILPGEVQGDDLAARFSSRCPGLPVLYMSGHSRDAIVHSGRLDEGVHFLSKPFTPQRLSLTVRQVLDSSRPAH